MPPNSSEGEHPSRPSTAGGNAAAAAACQNGGYLNYTDADGNAFRNEGHCVSYAARGGTLVPIATAPFSVVYSSLVQDWLRATVTGVGLEPNSAYELALGWPSRSVTVQATADAGGGFTHLRDEMCLDSGGEGPTTVTALGTPAGGAPTTYSLELPDASVCP